MFRDQIPEAQRLAYMTADDIKDLQYGAKSSVFFPSLQWGCVGA
jgi:hypothetical protein